MKSIEHSDIYQECLEYFFMCSTLFYRSTKLKFKDRDDELFTVMASCLNTARAVHNLASVNETENEAIMLMRALLERLVNYNYLRKSNEEEYEKYWLYPYYRMYHNTNQSIGDAGSGIHVALDKFAVDEFKKHSKVNRALTVFSSTDSRMGWTKKSFNERLEEVVKLSTLSKPILMINSLLTYRSASESLHGSIYGIMQLTGLFEINNTFSVGNIDKQQVRLNVEQNLGFRLTLLGYFMADTVRSLSVDYKNMPLEEDASKQLGTMGEIWKKLESIII